MMRVVRVVVLSLLAALALPGQASAEPILEVGPGNVTVQADKLEVDVAGGSAVLLGSVTLSKGDLLVKCPRVDLRFDTAPHVKWLKGSGGVVADVRGVHAEAPEVELDMAKQVLELRGGVKLSRGQGWLEANRATIELATAKVTAHQVKGSLPVPKTP
jgi:lipopolysaccharide export system protein LptA